MLAFSINSRYGVYGWIFDYPVVHKKSSNKCRVERTNSSWFDGNAGEPQGPILEITLFPNLIKDIPYATASIYVYVVA